MCKKLLKLCELQLASMLKEVEVSVVSATNSATASLELCSDMSDCLNKHSSSIADHALAADFKREVQNIMVNLQFHDELAQRVAHMQQIFSLIDQEISLKNQDLDCCDESMMKKVSEIFSIESEFDELQKIYPELIHVSASESIELF